MRATPVGGGPATINALVATLLCLLMTASIAADRNNIIRAVTLDAEKLAGVNLPAEEQFIAPEDVLVRSHRPRGEILH